MMNMRSHSKRAFLIAGLAWLAGACTSTNVTTTQPLVANRYPEESLRQPWLLVDTKKNALMVMKGSQPIKTFPRIAVGSSGVGIKNRRGDNKTPLGIFRVGWVNERSRFKTFIGLDYPNLDYAERALRTQKIDALTYERIRAAWMTGHTPPQDTPLGGQIGIHGLGSSDPVIHGAGINWTSGCVALDNYQITALMPWVRKGMRVEIR